MSTSTRLDHTRLSLNLNLNLASCGSRLISSELRAVEDMYSSISRLRGGAAIRASRQIRFNTTEAGQKTVSPHVGFYKTFTRPVVKVLLMATFTYQLAYWGWVYLEKAEIKKQKNAEVEGLEKQLAELAQGKEKRP
ncbi:hypothetical protein BKA65DRAFT_36216, partial [Rhexocercosporidium sp. MPI-PUGE-AT-0058]